MKTLASRFLSFEETLGAGLVKFAYFVLLALLIVLTVAAVIGGVVMMFTVGFWAGLGAVLIAPVRFVVALILLRVATEVVLAVLSIDDHLTDGARAEGALPPLRPAPTPAPAPARTEAQAVSVSAPAAADAGGLEETASAGPKPAAKKAARKATKKSAKAKATTASAASATSTASTKKTAAAAKAAPRPGGATGDEDAGTT